MHVKLSLWLKHFVVTILIYKYRPPSRPLHHNSVFISKKAMEESRSYRKERKQTKKKTGRGSGSRSIHIKMRKLRVLIPGGRRLNQPDLLLSKTADYIMHLELRIRFLKAISDIYSLS